MTELVEFNIKLRLAVIWVLARREILDFWRSKTRIITSFVQGLMFLIVFSGGFSSFQISIQGVQIDSSAFVASGICAMSILFSGIFGGMGVMRDKMFGFMKELIVAPIRRQMLMVGRTVGIALQTLIQSLIIFFISFAFGYFGYDWRLIWRILLYVPVALLASLGIVGLGLTIGSRMRDFQSFGLIQTFIVMPMFWFSGAFFAFSTVPPYMQIAMYFNPFAYSVDLFRFVLFSVSFIPVWLDLLVMSLFGLTFIIIGARSFNKMEVT